MLVLTVEYPFFFKIFVQMEVRLSYWFARNSKFIQLYLMFMYIIYLLLLSLEL